MKDQRKRRKLIKRLISGVSALALSVGLLGSIPASADDSAVGYKYTLFAYSSEEGAISSSAANFCVNGNIAANGTISAGQNINVNGEKKEHANEAMPEISKAINEKFFAENVDVKAENYAKNETNIEVKVPTDVKGKAELKGNIQLSAGLKAMGDITLSGNVLNKNSTVLFSEKGNIVINTENANLTGLIYAPKGNITIESKNLNLNSVVMIANKITLNSPNININNSASMAKFVQEAIDNNGSSSSNEEPDPTADPVIYAYGEYNEETKSVDIEWYSNVTGEFAVLESINGTDYTIVSKVSDDTKYSIKVTSDFIKKYYKVSIIKDNKTIASIPFSIVNANGKYSTELLDTDTDGLADLYEEMLGTDKTLPDTDKDGLTDYDEAYITNTDPTKYDSVTEGVSDADADNDKDGLTNKREIELKTDPNSDDTDGDNLKDGDEVSKYNTDPTKRDTDGDELEDDDELKFNFDPNKEDTDNNGIIDGKEKHQQTLDVVPDNKEQPITKVNISMTATGNIEKTTTVESIMNKDVLCSNVVGLVGEPFSIESESSFEKATITFTVDKTKLGETEFDNLMFLWYDRENDNFVELDTSHDAANSTVSIETTHFSEYMIVDSRTWKDAWKKIEELNKYYDSLKNKPKQSVSVLPVFNKPSQKTVTIYVTCCDDLNDPYVLMDDGNGNTYTNYRSLVGDLLIASMREPKGDINAYEGCRQTVSYNEKDDYITFLNIDYLSSPNSILCMDGIRLLNFHYFTKYATRLELFAKDFYKSNRERQAALDDLTFNPDCVWNRIESHNESNTRVVYVVDRDITKLCDVDLSINNGMEWYWFLKSEGCLDSYKSIEDFSREDKLLHLFAGPKNERNNITVDFLCIGGFDKTNLERIANTANGKVYDLAQMNLNDAFTYIKQNNDKENLEIDNDDDGLPDIIEKKGIPLSDGRIITTDPTKKDYDKDKLKDGEEIVPFVEPTRPDCHWLYEMKSDPTKEDSDNDGLLDGSAQFYNGKPLAPQDPNPLDNNNGRAWKNHIEQVKNGDKSAYGYSNEYYKPVDFECELKFAFGIIPYLDNNLIEYASSWTSVIGSFFLDFKYDDKKIALHSDTTQWQSIGGYNDFYDKVFNIATDMKRIKLTYNYNDQNYVVWVWKGNYMNLGAGAEVGFYTQNNSLKNKGIEQWDVDGTLPMTLSLYKQTKSGVIYDTYFNWYPDEDQWWITGFVPDPFNEYLFQYKFIKSILETKLEFHADYIEADELLQISSVDFSSEPEMLSAIKDKWQNKEESENLIFDERSSILWIVF